ncbi:MAG: tRNA (adenosine(37)-N6)-threonylcarbamoyltransferase complex ATPase subunit type 1 TsaE [Patescibacteria group bacterium]|nr:tRNA (adenosine(37)-N6)-threonylcarbamoyltransferase complex ATPase subunit type 1 TsaE [Patescibacteria group bacterium]MDD5121110.1 tRNA (adenosine(37)-N6)-threonylcarbamoyltransferase complex ATPase subunit type 1 TsaE [Patescibacteria group bacterium]MDD5221918.1 tRNA (adenosine(37)-N6)-threonylcarbamoyltransferase complex ATPase subunit type 1 TsaE [Patescibacteria group bacterium]MDD5395971.1 tRNA (adenosine(37)-N6)-threonylcarbamoyltransferase complex ATPase subunit type 1 TsaE [Patesc
MKTHISHSTNETLLFGQLLAKDLRGGETLALTGDLGSGKTVLTKGLAIGLGIKNIINSPTFVLMKVYQNKKSIRRPADKIKYLIHVDAYRLTSSKELMDIGLGDWFNKKNAIVVIEWADRVKNILPKGAIKIKIKINHKKNLRKFTIV